MALTDTQNFLLQQAQAQQPTSSGGGSNLADSLVRSGLTSATRNLIGPLTLAGLALSSNGRIGRIRNTLGSGLGDQGLARSRSNIASARAAGADNTATTTAIPTTPGTANLSGVTPNFPAGQTVDRSYFNQLMAENPGMSVDQAATLAGNRAYAASQAPSAAEAGATDLAAGEVGAEGAAGAVPAATTAATTEGTLGLTGPVEGLSGAEAGLLGGAVLPAAIGAGVGVLGGNAVSGLIDQANLGGQNSRLDSGLSNAARGAGYGFAVGSIFGAPPIGAALGAVIDGGLHAIFGNHDSPETQFTKASDKMNATVGELALQLGIPNGAPLQQVRDALGAQLATFQSQKDWSGGKDYLKSLSTALPAAMLQAQQQQKQLDTYNQRVMQMQATFGPMFQSISNASIAENKGIYQQQLQAADQIAQSNPALAASTRLVASQSQSNNDALLAAYAQQVAVGSGQQVTDVSQIPGAQATSQAYLNNSQPIR